MLKGNYIGSFIFNIIGFMSHILLDAYALNQCSKELRCMTPKRTIGIIFGILANGFKRLTSTDHVLISPHAVLTLNPNLSVYSIGKFSYAFSPPNVIADENNPQAKIEVGNFCSIGTNVTILLGLEHRPDWVTTYPFNIFLKQFGNMKGTPVTRGSVIIGNDV